MINDATIAEKMAVFEKKKKISTIEGKESVEQNLQISGRLLRPLSSRRSYAGDVL
jgi:hypothetical protein